MTLNLATLCLALMLGLCHAAAPLGYILAKMGESCSAACAAIPGTLTCNTDVETHNRCACYLLCWLRVADPRDAAPPSSRSSA